MPNILIADDNIQICSILRDYSIKEGFTPYIAHDGDTTLDLFNTNSFDMILLDVMMPKKDGFEVCRQIRKESSVPIIMITARSEDFEKIMGLDIGADDYIVKPFSPAEVMARVRAILRRMTTNNNKSKSNTLIIDTLKIDIDNFIVSIDNNEITLTRKEIEILWTLAATKGKIFTRDNLLDAVWGIDYFGDIRTVDSHIKRLRSKLDKYKHDKWEIKTIWGIGYKFEEINYEK